MPMLSLVVDVDPVCQPELVRVPVPSHSVGDDDSDSDVLGGLGGAGTAMRTAGSQHATPLASVIASGASNGVRLLQPRPSHVELADVRVVEESKSDIGGAESKQAHAKVIHEKDAAPAKDAAASAVGHRHQHGEDKM